MSSTRDEDGFKLEQTVAECMRYILENEISTDVNIEVGPPDGQTVTFRAHKCILMSRSEVFEGMFSSGMTECRSDPDAKVRIQDIDADIFKQLLKYIYYDSTSISPESSLYLMYAAEKYMLPKLVAACWRCLVESLDVNNVIFFLEESFNFDNQELRSNCLKLISLNSKAVLTGTDILSASQHVMNAILETETIPLSEFLIYETAVNWAVCQLQSAIPDGNPTDLQIRDALGDLLYKIRFPVMKPDEFAEISSGSSILTIEEKESIYCYIATKKARQLRFPIERRIGEEVWIDRTGRIISDQWHSTPSLEAINFTCDQEILLTGIGLFTGYDGKGYEVHVEILQADDCLFEKRVSIPYTGNIDPYKVSLDEPIVVKVGVVYCIKTLPDDSIGHYAYYCHPEQSKDKITFTFSSHPESPLTADKFGQIPRLYFCVL